MNRTLGAKALLLLILMIPNALWACSFCNMKKQGSNARQNAQARRGGTRFIPGVQVKSSLTDARAYFASIGSDDGVVYTSWRNRSGDSEITEVTYY